MIEIAFSVVKKKPHIVYVNFCYSFLKGQWNESQWAFIVGAAYSFPSSPFSSVVKEL